MSIGVKENKSVEGLLTFLGECPIVFDIGSNKGQWTDIILNRFEDNCRVWLFEPNKKLLSFTEIKYEYRTNIIYNELAGYKECKQVEFYYFDNFNNELSSLYEGIGWEDTLPMKVKDVTAVRIDSYCQLGVIPYIDYLKIDAEGSDIDVILGCSELMKENKIGIIQFEYGEHYKRANHSIKEVFNICKETGYNIYRYEKENWNLVEEFEDTWEAEDFFITKFDIHNYSVGGWNNHFKISTAGLDKFGLVCEIGSFEGLTTKYICENLLEDGGRVIAIDPLLDVYFEGDNGNHPYFKDQYQRFLRNTWGLPIELYRDNSENVLPEFNALRFDFTFIDGNHWPPHPYNDAVWVFAETKIGGFILFDDYDLWNETTKENIDKFLSEFEGSYEVVSKGYQILIKKTEDKYNSITQDYYK